MTPAVHHRPQLNARRRAAANDPAVETRAQSLADAASARLDPFHAFGHYPTERLTPATRLTLGPGVTRGDLDAALDHALFSGLSLSRTQVEAVFGVLASGSGTIGEIAAGLRTSSAPILRAAALLMKLGVAHRC